LQLASGLFENKINSKIFKANSWFKVRTKFALSPLSGIKRNGARCVDRQNE